MRARFGLARVDAPEAGDEFEIFERRQLVVDHRLVGDPRHHPLGRNRIGEGIDAEHGDRPGVRAQQADDHAQRRGLAGAVRPEQRVELAVAHGEVETVDCRAVVEGFCADRGFRGAGRVIAETRREWLRAGKLASGNSPDALTASCRFRRREGVANFFGPPCTDRGARGAACGSRRIQRPRTVRVRRSIQLCSKHHRTAPTWRSLCWSNTER